MSDLPGRDAVEDAAGRIRPWVRETPVVPAEADVAGVADVVLKLECIQRTGSFKARGAFNAMLAAAVPAEGVVTASGGNHGAAVAYAAMRLGHKAAIFVPETAPAMKVERLRRYGAEVRQVGRMYAEAYEAAVAHQAATGARMLHAYDQPEILAGQGTVGVEFVRQAPGLDTVVIAVGGGGLIGGVLAALGGSGVKVVAVESTGTPTLHQALAAGAPVDVAVGGIAADSLGASRVGALGFALAQAHLGASVLVEDADIRAAQLRLWDSFRVIAEPGGAAAFAAVLSGAYRPAPGERVGVLVCGGNADLGVF